MSEGLVLTLVRHAKSSWRFAGLDDFSRPINRRGLRDLVRMPRLVAARLPAPDLVLSSDAVRAVQTCQAIADAFGVDESRVRLDHRLYLADAPVILDRVAHVAGSARHVLVVGHNPGLTDLFNHLVSVPVDNLPTLAVAMIALDAPDWSSVGPGCGQVKHRLLPKEMARDE